MRAGKIGLQLVLLVIILMSCKKDTKTETENTPGTPVNPSLQYSLVFNFKALLNDLPLDVTSPKFFTNINGDSITVSKFNYYISNIRLKKINGDTFIEKESYHLIRHEDLAATSFTLSNIPEGTYNYIEFLIGVDSTRNVSGAQTGALDPGNTMFWDWNNGYIFMKLEGDFKTFTTPAGSNYGMHIGGYSAPYSCIRKYVFASLPSSIVISKQAKPVVYFNTIVDEIFKTPNVIDIDSYFSVQTGKNAVTVADNYADMFVLDKITN